MQLFFSLQTHTPVAPVFVDLLTHVVFSSECAYFSALWDGGIPTGCSFGNGNSSPCSCRALGSKNVSSLSAGLDGCNLSKILPVHKELQEVLAPETIRVFDLRVEDERM